LMSKLKVHEDIGMNTLHQILGFMTTYMTTNVVISLQP
jgi:hypothetical protein